MLDDPTCIIFLGLSGAMIPGGMRKVIRDMIETKLIDVIVSTGANIFHDIFENFGYRHYVGSEDGDDDALRKHRIVRVHDALMDDHEINQVIQLLSKIPEELEERVVSSRGIWRFWDAVSRMRGPSSGQPLDVGSPSLFRP
jgi:deoxyhypusine synthase